MICRKKNIVDQLNELTQLATFFYNMSFSRSRFRGKVSSLTNLDQSEGKDRYRCLKSYSPCGRAVVNQAVQHTQQVVLPVQVAESLLHNTGKRVVLEVLQREYVLPSEKRKRSIFYMNTCEQHKTDSRSVLLACFFFIKGALCSLRRRHFIQKWNIFLCLNKTNTFFTFLWLDKLDKHTDLEGQQSIPCYFVYNWRTLMAFQLQTVFWGPYFSLQTTCSFS